MNKLYLALAIVLLFNTKINAQLTAKKERKQYAKDGYRLAWADEFNVNGKPVADNWRFEHGFVRNQELQWYQEANAWCEKGFLIIEARKEQKSNPNYKPDSKHWGESRKDIEYTSASINTATKHTWQYGRFVMRGKINVSDGLWPAWWTLGANGQWPSNGEIDIMEYYQKKLLANIAIGTSKPYNAHWFSETKSIESLGGEKWASQFHVWRMDWDEEAISLYVDDLLLNKVEMSKLSNRDQNGNNPFKQPHYMLLNLAMGGMNGGSLYNTKFPNRFVIDYVRVYQKNK